MVIHRRTTSPRSAFDLALYALMGLLAFCFVYPFWYTIVLSLSTPTEANTLGLRFFARPFVLDAYRETFRSKAIGVGYLNTIIRTLFGTFFTVSVSYAGAYALSKKDLPFRNTLTALVLFTMFFSGGLVANYLNIKSLGLLDSRAVLVLPTLTSAWNLVIARNFILSLPRELEDSAFIDGCNPLQMILFVMLPLSRPILGVLALWSATYHWNAWFDALIYITDTNKMVLQLALYRIVQEQSEEVMRLMLRVQSTAPTRTTLATVKAATIVVTIGPIILLYPFLQRYFVKGLLVGSLKG